MTACETSCVLVRTCFLVDRADVRLEGRGACMGCAARGETMIFVCIVCLNKSHSADVPAGMLPIWQRLQEGLVTWCCPLLEVWGTVLQVWKRPSRRNGFSDSDVRSPNEFLLEAWNAKRRRRRNMFDTAVPIGQNTSTGCKISYFSIYPPRPLWLHSAELVTSTEWQPPVSHGAALTVPPPLPCCTGTSDCLKEAINIKINVTRIEFTVKFSNT